MWNAMSATTVELASGMRMSMGTLAFGSGVTALGAGIPLVGANCPAGTLTAPVTYLKITCPDGGVGYIPVWR